MTSLMSLYVQVKQRKETSGKVLLNAYFNTRATPSCKKNRAAFFFNNEQDKIGYIGTKASSTIPIFWWNPHFNDFLFCLFGLVWFENTLYSNPRAKLVQTCSNLSKLVRTNLYKLVQRLIITFDCIWLTYFGK